jgi:transposase
MGQKQLQRWHLMEMVEGGKITLKEAGEKIGVSYRQSKRIRRAVREKGMKGLIHGNVGRPSNHRIDERLRDKVLKLSKEVYGDFNDTHFVEQLKEREGVGVSRETVRRWRREAGMEPKRSVSRLETRGRPSKEIGTGSPLCFLAGFDARSVAIACGTGRVGWVQLPLAN